MARTWKADAIARGREAGENAAGWWIQENGGGRDTTSTKDLGAWAERFLEGLDSCDPEYMDQVPAPDLSGQWADTETGPSLVESITGIDREADPPARVQKVDDAFSDLCDAYEAAFGSAAEAAIYKHLRSLVRAAKEAA